MEQQEHRLHRDGSRLRVILQLFWVFFKIGAFTFGGGYAMLPLIHRELGERRSWLEPEELTDMLAIAQSAPGVLAINAATFTGYRIAGFGGAAAAILGATLPSLIVIVLVAIFFLGVQNNRYVIRIFYGLRPTVFSLIAIAAWQVGRDIFHLRGRQGTAAGGQAGTANDPTGSSNVHTEPANNQVFSIAVATAGLLAMLIFHPHPILLIVLAGTVGVLRGFLQRRVVGELRARPEHPSRSEGRGE
ncbi:MAG: chromate transporter [Limnochordaceae bacterium]|nr:chromate transporter [Limnochordaceae bacterium]